MSGLKFTADQIQATGSVLNDSTGRPIGQRFRALFTLRNIAGQASIDQISRCLLDDDSALLKHECAYCLGQMQDPLAIPVLNQVLANIGEHPMVRHEAAEALGAIGAQQSLDVLKKYLNDDNKSVAETCQLAISRIEHLLDSTNELVGGDSIAFKSVDPVPHLKRDNDENNNVQRLESMLTDSGNDLFTRYRAMFALRNLNTDESAVALANGLQCPDSALFRHEVAYVLGQMQNPRTVDQLAKVLANFDENEMVRHECAEALGAIATTEAERELNKYIDDRHRVVRESVEVALDMTDYNNSDDFQYANTLSAKTMKEM
ncbi:deoxyhypusine hydroxylase-like [Oppia nitens]|uniref:deoxyhypusine hydroxylase-like n=1 Tax=Oppia nitens TaxID=1686743 RepID=UPI0023DBA554|nr:deoxyhypusine hydroxylase-like [Oppia nitens]